MSGTTVRRLMLQVVACAVVLVLVTRFHVTFRALEWNQVVPWVWAAYVPWVASILLRPTSPERQRRWALWMAVALLLLWLLTTTPGFSGTYGDVPYEVFFDWHRGLIRRSHAIHMVFYRGEVSTVATLVMLLIILPWSGKGIAVRRIGLGLIWVGSLGALFESALLVYEFSRAIHTAKVLDAILYRRVVLYLFPFRWDGGWSQALAVYAELAVAVALAVVAIRGGVAAERPAPRVEPSGRIG